jgi:hypothetical protein
MGTNFEAASRKASIGISSPAIADAAACQAAVTSGKKGALISTCVPKHNQVTTYSNKWESLHFTCTAYVDASVCNRGPQVKTKTKKKEES